MRTFTSEAFNSIVTRDFIISNIYPVLCSDNEPKKLNDIITLPFLDMQLRFRVILDNDNEGFASFELTKSTAENFSLDIPDITRAAKANAEKHIRCQAMFDTLSALGGIPFTGDDNTPMYVVCTDFPYYGAGSAFLCKKVFCGVTGSSGE